MALDLKHILRIARRWWWILLLAPIIGGATAFYSADQQPRMYSADATLLINAGVTTSNAGSIQASRNLSETYSGWVVSRPVLERVAETLAYEGGIGQLEGRVSAVSVPDTLFIRVSATSNDPDEAARIANTVANEFVLDVQRQTEAQNAVVRSSVDQQIADTENAIARLDGLIAELEASEDALTTAESSRLQSLLTERAQLQIDLDQLVMTVRSIDVELATAQTSIIVQSPAVPPTAPFAPQITRSTVIGFGLGIILAIAAVVLLEYLDDTVRTSDQFARLSNAPLLTSIARAPTIKRGGSRLFVLDDPTSPAAEAMRLLRANIEFASAPDHLSSLVITSPEAEEGKSTIVANLGVVMAQAGFRTVIIDADLRRPSQHGIFGIPNTRGVSSLLVTPDPDWRQELISLSIPNLVLIPSGPLPPNPSDLLSLDRFNHIIAELSEWADVVLIDCPPVLAASDALVVSAKAKGTLLVCKHGQTRRGTLRRATSLLRQGHARLIGLVLNQTRAEEVEHYGRYSEPARRDDAGAARYYFGRAANGTSYQVNGKSNGKVEHTVHQSTR